MKALLLLTLPVLLAVSCNVNRVDISKNNLMDTRWGLGISTKSLFDEYPRPRMQRNEWKNLCGTWEYAITDNFDDFPKAFDGEILVPFAIESQLSGVQKPLNAGAYLWYRLEVKIPGSWEGQQILLNFGAVDWHAKVFINKLFAGEHKGGFTPFSLNITDKLAPGKQEIMVAVYDPTDTQKQARGKQTLNPKGILYTAVSGIWQPVWLEPVPKKYIQKVLVTPDPDSRMFRLNILGCNVTEDMMVAVKVYNEGENVLTVSKGVNNQIELPIENPKLWEPGNPNLYDIEIELLQDDKPVDKVKTYSAMRKVSVGTDAEGIPRIMLNDKFIFQYGLLDQGWWPDGLLTPPSYDALRYDVDFTLAAGFNTIRKHVKTEPEVFYQYCDKMGVLVWQDMPHGDDYNYKNKQPVKDLEVARQYEKELMELVDYLSNYPSIIMWVPFNEGWGQYDTRRVTEMVKKKDPSRIVNSPSGWVDMGAGDVYDVHRYPGPGKVEDAGGRPFLIGEFGGLGCPIEGRLWNPEMRNWGYLTFTDKDTFKQEYKQLIYQLPYLKAQGLSGAIYTQTTDVEGEVNGLLTYDRVETKIPVDELKQLHAKLYTTPPKITIVMPDSEKEPQAWKYTMDNPGEGWFAVDFNDANWNVGMGVFGYDNPSSQLGMSYARRNDPNAMPRTEWHTADLWLRKTIELSTLPENPHLWIRHDDSAEIYINGNLVINQGHRTAHYEHYFLLKLNNEQKMFLKKGVNTIAIHAKNNLDKGIHFAGANQSVDLAIINLTPAN